MFEQRQHAWDIPHRGLWPLDIRLSSWGPVWCFIFSMCLICSLKLSHIPNHSMSCTVWEARRPKICNPEKTRCFGRERLSKWPQFRLPIYCVTYMQLRLSHTPKSYSKTLRNISKDDCSCWFSWVPIHLFDMFSVAFKMFQKSSDSFWSPFTVDSIAKSQVAIVQRFPPPVWWIWHVQPLGDMQMCHPPKVFPQRWALCGYWEARFLVSSWNWNALKRMF